MAQRRQQQERSRQSVLAAALDWLAQHGGHYGIDHGYVFGSVTQPGRFSEGADVDVAVDSLAIGDPFGLSSYLSLHLDRDVDVVPLDQCHFAGKIREQGTPWNAINLPD